MPITEHLKLSDLTRMIQGVIGNSFDNRFFWVIGEVSGHKFYPDTDRHYLELVEKVENSGTETSKIKAKAWFEGSKNIRRFEDLTGQKFSNGLSVLVKIKVEFQPIHGLSVTIFDIDEAFTLGNIAQQREATLKRLLIENADSVFLINGEYSTRNKQLLLRNVIQYIALVASPNSDGYKDFSHSLAENQHGYKFRVDNYFSSVQGKDAENELVETFKKIFYSGNSYDAVVVIRGGGSKTDFLVFDTYTVSRVVARFPVPVITGIGHHADVSIVDIMANTATKTPTQAAEFIISRNRVFEDSLISLKQRFTALSQQMLHLAGKQLHELELLSISRPATFVSKSRSQLNMLSSALNTASRNAINHHQKELSAIGKDIAVNSSLAFSRMRTDIKAISAQLKNGISKTLTSNGFGIERFQTAVSMADPGKILRRGFSLIRKNDKIVTEISDIKSGDRIDIETSTHHIKAEILNTEKKHDTGNEL